MYGIKINGVWLLDNRGPLLMYENPTLFKFKTKESAETFIAIGELWHRRDITIEEIRE